MRKELLMFAVAVLLGCVSVDGRASEFCDVLANEAFEYTEHTTPQQVKRGLLGCALRYRETHIALLKTRDRVQLIIAADPASMALRQALAVIDSEAKSYRDRFVQLEKRAAQIKMTMPTRTPKIPM